MLFNTIFETLKTYSNEQKAKEMSRYMKNNFLFLGVQSPIRKKITKPFLATLKKDNAIAWELTEQCWQNPYRELQYFALDYLGLKKEFLTLADIPKLKDLALRKSWWDSIDQLDRIIGGIALRFPELNHTLLVWSVDDNFWLRRIAIDHQLLRKEKTNTDLLEKIIVNNLGQTEFFINKAIGWSLRDYSKTNPEWVRDFIKRHESKMTKLSVREACKYI
ncbi:DNA alkylation repair protein [Capnocytophaga canis]|uniref:DNA alkylation repair protein n=1 Tax=Capnocytophaga canis TaxID=1848903 RepID=UPI0037D40203